MDEHRFDQLTQSFARASSRRGLLKAVLGLGGVLGITAVLRERTVDAARRGFSGPTFLKSPTPTPPSCPSGLLWCGTGCIDSASDPMNCGGCGVTCTGGTTCQGGSCAACKADISSCSAGSECCSGYCAIYGASGNQCEPCAGTLCSGFECSNLMTDDFNCGACGNQCTTGTYCWDGVCRADCFPPYIAGCTSNAQCCDPAAYCRQGGGVSVCESCAGTICGDFLCVDTMTDVQHCGGCGVSCGAGGYCYQGQCTTCTPPGFDCSGNSDCCTGYCQSYGASGNACDECSGTICGESVCVDLNSNNSHCGTCGNACSGGATCQLGICIAGIGT